MNISKGALEGLSSFLISFSSLLEENQVELASLFRYVLSGVSGAKDWSRYDVPRAGIFIFLIDYFCQKFYQL